jgi:DTW domain-containing protein YfiP
VILQHPQEDDVALGTARLVTLTLPAAQVRVGLSWGSLAHAVGVEAIDRERWAVLAAAKPPSGAPEPTPCEPVLLLDRKGRPRDLARHGLDGIVVLDGTWSQAKTLWWRNPWLLKLPRLLLVPQEPSIYGRLRRAPRREWVSTLEAVAEVLPALGEPAAARDSLRRLMRTLLQRARDAGAAPVLPRNANSMPRRRRRMAR